MTTHPNALKESASQTAGPYVHIGCVPSVTGLMASALPDLGAPMISDSAKGERISITGRVLDGEGEPLRDALVEIWQADHSGLFHSPAETRGNADPHAYGWGRQATGFDTGEFRFETIKPGPVPWPDGRLQAPHAALMIAARGINLALHTRYYFGDEIAANETDPLLQLAGDRAGTMIASPGADGTYHLEIILQGDAETVFLDI